MFITFYKFDATTRKSLVNQKLYLSKIDKQDLVNYKQDKEFREVIDYLTNDNLDFNR